MADRTRISRRDVERAILTLGASLLADCATYRSSCPADARRDDPFEGYQFRYLSKLQAVTIAAATEIMVGDCPPVISAVEVAKRADQFLDRIRSVPTARMRVALTALEEFGGILSTLNLKVFSAASLEERRAVLDRLVRASGPRARHHSRHQDAYGVSVLTHMPVYADRSGSSSSSIDRGLAPFAQTGCLIPSQRASDERGDKGGKVDVVVIGSGAAGSVMAYRSRPQRPPGGRA